MKKTKNSENKNTKTDKNKIINPSAIKKQYLNQYSYNPNFSNWEPNEKIIALNNRYGFLGILNSGFKSEGENTLEISIPEDYDLIIKEENGFSIFFWLILNKQQNYLTRYIIKKGSSIDELTPTIGLLQNNSNLFIKITSSNQRIETLISNKKLYPNKIYSICFSVNFDNEEEITEMILYIDGILDSQISIPGIPNFNNGNFFLGKPDITTHGFNGIISEIMLCPRNLEEREINEIYNECINYFYQNQGESFQTAIIFENKFQRGVLLEKYIKYTGSKPFIIDNLSLSNFELKEIVKKYDEDERNNDLENNVNNNIDDPNQVKLMENMDFMLSNNDEFIVIKKFYLNSKIINTILFLCNRGDDLMEIKRVIDVFEILSENLLFNIDYNFIYRLCKNLNCISNDNKYYFSLSIFFHNLKQIHDIYFPDENINQPIIYENEPEEPIKQYENLLMSTQGFKNIIDENEMDNQNFKSCKIKNIYQKKEKINNNNNKNSQEGFYITSKVENDNNTINIIRPESAQISIKNNQNEKKLENKITENENENIYTETKENIEKNKIEEKNEYSPEYPKNWSEGNFEVIINHCYNCHQHKMTTRHLEFQFIDKFNEIGEAIKIQFPNCIIYGNYENLEYFGQFDIYLRGIGPFFDNLGRFFIFKKQKYGRFPKINEVLDKLITLSIIYGGSVNMESAQKQFLKDNFYKKSKFFHDLPANYSEKCLEAMNEFIYDREKKDKKKIK